jgi:hypothetical protein
VHRPPPVELVEDQADDPLGLLIRVERDFPGRRLDVPGRDAGDQLPAAGLVQLPMIHPLFEDMQFCLAHHAGQPEHQAVRILGRVVHPVGVGQQDTEPATELQQVVPVLAGAGQPAHLQPEDQTDAVQGDLGEQPLESRPAFDRLPTLAEVVVDDLDLRSRPAQCDGAVGQGVLAGGGLLVVEDLLGSGLPDVDDGGPVEVPGPEPRGRRVKPCGGHDAPPAARPLRR